MTLRRSDSPPGSATLLHHQPYRWLVAGSTVNALGNGISPVALAFAVLDLGGDASDLGIVVGLYALADLVAVLFGGVLGDRLSRTAMMRGAMTGAALAQGVAAASLVGGWGSIWLLAVAGVAIGALGALSVPSSRAVTQQTVPATMLRGAIASRRLAQNVAMILGNGAAGLLVVGLGSGWALGVDAATFALAAACFSRVHVPRLPAPEPGAASMLGEVRAGFAEVRRHTWLWVLILQALLYHLFYGGSQGVLGPIVVGHTFGRPAWGWALAAMMAGFVAGGVVSLRWRPNRALLAGTGFLALTACFPAAMAFSTSLTVLLVGAFLHGFGLEIFSVSWDLSIQENVAADRLARVFAVDMVGSFLARPLGLALTGPVAELTGYRPWLAVVAGVIGGSSLLALLTPAVRRLERRPPVEMGKTPR